MNNEPIYTEPCPGLTGNDRVTKPCRSCSGSRHCPYCRGAGTISLKVSSVRARARRDHKRTVEQFRRVHEAAEARELYVATHPKIMAALESLNGIFKDSLVANLQRTGRLSEKQEVAVLKAVADAKAEEFASPVPEGLQGVQGVVVSLRDSETRFGYVLKMVVRDEFGFKVYGTVPTSIRGTIAVGDAVCFAAELQPSDDDPRFGFFKRPRLSSHTPAARD